MYFQARLTMLKTEKKVVAAKALKGGWTYLIFAENCV
jgi:hypothetical protein